MEIAWMKANALLAQQGLARIIACLGFRPALKTASGETAIITLLAFPEIFATRAVAIAESDLVFALIQEFGAIIHRASAKVSVLQAVLQRGNARMAALNQDFACKSASGVTGVIATSAFLVQTSLVANVG